MNKGLFQSRSAVPLVAMLVFSVAIPREAKSMDSVSNPREVVETLRMIKAGYEASNTEKNVLMRGKIFYVQRAEEGKTIPESERDDPDWLDFMYARKGDQWRYEQQFSIDPTVKLTRLCDSDYAYKADGRAGQDITSLEIAPNTAEIGPAFADLMARFYILDFHESGYENVPIAMDTMIDLIDREKKEEDFTKIEVIKKASVFEISRSNGMWCEMTVRIDPNQGFNMTSSNTLQIYPGALTAVTSAEMKFEQVKPGFWLPRTAEIRGNSRGVVIESKLVIDEYFVGDFEFDERLFTRESIKLAPNARIGLRDPVSLVGRQLKDMKGLGVESLPDANGKMVLVAFWDMAQRPSRHCVTQLAKMADELAGKGVVTVVVQASEADKEALQNWIQEYKMPFASGMLGEDGEKVRFAWGVKSLPWLILTDAQHVVRANGFARGELSAKIDEVKR